MPVYTNDLNQILNENTVELDRFPIHEYIYLVVGIIYVEYGKLHI